MINKKKPTHSESEIDVSRKEFVEVELLGDLSLYMTHDTNIKYTFAYR